MPLFLEISSFSNARKGRSKTGTPLGPCIQVLWQRGWVDTAAQHKPPCACPLSLHMPTRLPAVAPAGPTSSNAAPCPQRAVTSPVRVAFGGVADTGRYEDEPDVGPSEHAGTTVPTLFSASLQQPFRQRGMLPEAVATTETPPNTARPPNTPRRVHVRLSVPADVAAVAMGERAQGKTADEPDDEKLVELCTAGDANGVAQRLKSHADSRVSSRLLHIAASQGHTGVVKVLLSHPGIDANGAGAEHRYQTALQAACSNGHEEVVRALISNSKVDVNRSHPHSGATPFFLACLRGREDVVRLLLCDSRVDVAVPDNNLCTPLYAAAGKGHVGIVRVLLSVPQVSVTAPNAKGCSPLFAAALMGRTSVVTLLANDARVSVTAPDNEGVSPVLAACRWRRVDTLAAMAAIPKFLPSFRAALDSDLVTMEDGVREVLQQCVDAGNKNAMVQRVLSPAFAARPGQIAAQMRCRAARVRDRATAASVLATRRFVKWLAPMRKQQKHGGGKQAPPDTAEGQSASSPVTGVHKSSKHRKQLGKAKKRQENKHKHKHRSKSKPIRHQERKTAAAAYLTQPTEETKAFHNATTQSNTSSQPRTMLSKHNSGSRSTTGPTWGQRLRKLSRRFLVDTGVDDLGFSSILSSSSLQSPISAGRGVGGRRIKVTRRPLRQPKAWNGVRAQSVAVGACLRMKKTGKKPQCSSPAPVDPSTSPPSDLDDVTVEAVGASPYHHQPRPSSSFRTFRARVSFECQSFVARLSRGSGGEIEF